MSKTRLIKLILAAIFVVLLMTSLSSADPACVQVYPGTTDITICSDNNSSCGDFAPVPTCTGITVNSVEYSSPNCKIINITNSPYAQDVCCFCVDITPSPTCVSVEPDIWSGSKKETLDVVITGENTHFNATSVVTFPGCPNITVDSITATSATTIIASITITEDAALCQSDINVTTGSEAVTCVHRFEIEPHPPSCVSVDPTVAMPGSNIDLAITGVNTHFDSTSEVIYICPGVTVNSVTATSATTIIANITIAPDAPSSCCKNCDLIVTTGTEVMTCQDAFDIVCPCATCQGVSPNAANAGATLDVIIELYCGCFYLREAENLEISFGCSGITVNSVTATNSYDLKANISVDCDAPACTGDVAITGVSSVGIICSSAFTVNGPLPCTLTLEPTSLRTGFFMPRIAQFTVAGSEGKCCEFDDTSTVTISGGVKVLSTEVISSSELRIKTLLPPVIMGGKGNKTVTVQTGDVTVTAALTVTGLIF
jgi:hypothetical protein